MEIDIANTLSFSDDDMLSLVADIAAAADMPIPGRARHSWVIANQMRRRQQSPPPQWIWLLIELLEKLIPFLIDWLKKNYGENWIDQLHSIVARGRLPWL